VLMALVAQVLVDLVALVALQEQHLFLEIML
jgi:hypothetical protein